MKFQVTSMNNFCRVFQLPVKYSEEFCFGGPIMHAFGMVDWFNPVPSVIGEETPLEIELQSLYDQLLPFLLKKSYVKAGHTYLVLCDFGAAFTFTAPL